ncbi:MAG TPA: MFS transporter [Burkholderiales bacterium]|nr:MFS transporter [Burkholderiales bacterium]
MTERMSRAELRAGAGLAAVYGLRMLGLFFILPVFAVHAVTLRGGHDLTLVGIAIGGYGLTQGLLQVPFGMASDRWGRKPIIYAGLLVFAAGSFLGIVATDIWTAIAARTLQGAGAINSVAMALAADLTREQHRTKVMAMIGATIGIAFALSLVGAPILYRYIGMGGVFALTGLLALIAIGVVKYWIPDQAPPAVDGVSEGSGLRNSLEPELLRLNAGIFILHIVLYAMFVVVPPLFVQAGLQLPEHWKVYLPVVLASFVLMIPAVLYADRRNRPKPVLLASVALLVAVEAALAAVDAGIAMLAGLMLGFFAAFNVLEALLPALVSRAAPASGRGAAIGVYNTTQTLGVFFGGLIGGWVASHYGTATVFALCALLSALWLALAAGMRAPIRVNELSTITFSIASGVNLDGLHQALAGVRGVREAEIVAAERIAHLKVVPGQWDENRVRKLTTGEV